MRSLLVLCSIVVAVSCGMRCSTDEHCGAPAVNAKCVDNKCEFYPLKPKRQACSTNADCPNLENCVDGKCFVDNGNGGRCSSDAYCPNGYTCVDSKCVVAKRRFGEHKDCPEDCRMPSCQC